MKSCAFASRAAATCIALSYFRRKKLSSTHYVAHRGRRGAATARVSDEHDDKHMMFGVRKLNVHLYAMLEATDIENSAGSAET
jgi:hypothetical protein